MYIKDIILDGFKCYEHRTVIKNLDKSYNAITGLNGSGKSNIIDGIIFVLGLESRKILRANSLKELINIHRKDCIVTLVLSNTDKNKSPEGYQDYKEIVVSRSIDDTGKSKYYLNNHSCTYATINKLCKSININSERGEFFFIVMQGHITKVLNMKSKEIGNLIEETAGTRSYTKEKEKALLTLEKKENKLKEVRDTLLKRISPFYSRLREERESYIEQKNIEQLKKKVKEEYDTIKKNLQENELSRNIKELKESIVEYLKDKRTLIELEENLAELQEIGSEENVNSIKDMFEDENFKLEKLKKLEKDSKQKISENIKKLNIIEEEIKKIEQQKTCLNQLKEQESIILGKLKSKNSIFKDDKIGEYEEIGKLKKMKSEIEYKIQRILESINAKNNINNLKDIDEVINIQKCEEQILKIESTKVDEDVLRNEKNRYYQLKSKINYTLMDGVYGTIDENIIFKEQKYKEAILTVLGGKCKHIIVENEKIGSELLKTSERRISVVPLNKIKSKDVKLEIIKFINKKGGIHLIDLIDYNSKLQKAMEHVFNGFFVFEDKNLAKEICHSKNVICVTLDGSIYDPKGTLTGGKSVFNNEIIRRAEIEALENNIREMEKNQAYFLNNRNKYEELLNHRRKYFDLRKMKEELHLINVKIETISKYNNSSLDIKEELAEIRKQILEAVKIENELKNKLKVREDLKQDITKLEKLISENEESKNKCIHTLTSLQEKLNQLELKNSNKRLSEKQVAGLEPKQKYLIKSTSKLENKINKIYNEIQEALKEESMKDIIKQKDRSSEEILGFLNDEIYLNLQIASYIFNLELSEVTNKEREILLNKLSKLEDRLDYYSRKKTIRMDPSNFDLLEKNEMSILSLKDKISQLESDKQKILKSINSFDLLGIKENEKAFNYLNDKTGKYLRYFLKDSDVKIIKEGDYELKVKVGNWKDSLNELSGGQRSLVAVCLIFSILTYRPAPFYIFDEIDSALDLSFTQSIGEIIKNEFKNSQFIIISLKNGMYENANSVYKVFIKDGKSNICQIK